LTPAEKAMTAEWLERLADRTSPWSMSAARANCHGVQGLCRMWLSINSMGARSPFLEYATTDGSTADKVPAVVERYAQVRDLTEG